MPTVFVRRPAAGSFERLGAFQRFLLFWTPALIGIAVIAVESQPLFSAANTSGWLLPIWQRLFGPVDPQTWGEFHHILRKCGHFIGYGTLCVLFLRAWLLTFAGNVSVPALVWRWRSWFCSIASTFAVASGDEIHQSFLPSRTGLFSDVLLDTAGGMTATGIVLAASWFLRRRGGED